MTFKQMVQIEPDLERLERSAEHAGRHGASWLDYLMASHEALSKCTGRGAQHEELQSGRAYELARAALFAAWSRGSKDGGPESIGGGKVTTSCSRRGAVVRRTETAEVYR